MHTIEVDFDVIRALMALRLTEAISNNEVIRGLLKLPPAKPAQKEAATGGAGDWVVKGARFAAGMDFRCRYQGRAHLGRVEDGALVVSGKQYNSPSAAAVAITGYAVNGWNFWECRMPGGEWRQMSSYRKGA